MTPTHTLHDIESLFERGQGIEGALNAMTKRERKYLLPENGVSLTKIIRFPKGSVIKRHCHTSGPILKILISGRIKYEEDEYLVPGDVAIVEADVFYEGEALEDSVLLLLEPQNCFSVRSAD